MSESHATGRNPEHTACWTDSTIKIYVADEAVPENVGDRTPDWLDDLEEQLDLGFDAIAQSLHAKYPGQITIVRDGSVVRP